MRVVLGLLLVGTACSSEAPVGGALAEAPVRVVRNALETLYTGPPDPVIAGDCELRVRLFDAQTGAGLRARAVLWRLDVPANRHWQRGDQALGFATLDGEGATVRLLTPGWYRFLIGKQRYGDPSPPEFLVQGPSTELRLEIRTRRVHPARVRVVDEGGRSLTGLLVARRPLTNSRRRGADRLTGSWVNVREGASEECHHKSYSSCCSFAQPYSEPELRTADEAGWIALSDIAEDTHAAQRYIQFKLAVPDDPRGGELHVTVRGRKLADQDYLCVVPGDEALELVLGSIRYRDGDPPVGRENLEWSARGALLSASSWSRKPWRHIPLQATLRHPLYKERTYRFTLAEPPRPRFLGRAETP